MNLWKAQILFGPTRFFKYNYQNFIGDLSGVIAGNPHAVTKVPRATEELWKYFTNPSGTINPELQDAIDRAVLSTTLTIQELPDVSTRLDIFKRFQDRPLSEQINIVKLWFTYSTKFTRFREAVLRYATYLDYLDKLQTGDYGKGPFKAFKYGASKPEEVDGLADPKDKAAKLSRDLLVDYGAISPAGKETRKYLIPFYSWLEGNMKRYNRLFANASREGISGRRIGGAASAQAAATGAGYAGLWALRFALFYAATQVWNNLIHKDEEERVKDYDKRRLHVVLGTDPETGDIMVLRGQDAFGDYGEWFGLNTLPNNIERLSNKEISLGDLAGDMVRSPYAKILNGISPGIKIPMAFFTGREYNADTGKTMPIRDFPQYMARTMGAEAAYNIVSGKPHRPIGKELETGFISRQDPEENAYSFIQEKKSEWNKKMGRGGAGDYYTPRSKYYQDYKRALRYKDPEAARAALSELRALGVNRKDLEKSLESAKPLYGIPKREIQAFLKSLSKEERIRLQEANKYYRKTFMK